MNATSENNAEYFVKCIGAGVAEAFQTCRFFLGVETESFENAHIHPEYVVTVEVAKKLTGVDRYVSLETHMKDVRRQAGAVARMRSIQDKGKWKEIDNILREYRFGSKDSQRIDIVVRPSDQLLPPLLLAEAKLGVGNVAGIVQDIDRIMGLLVMHHRLKLLDRSPVYGAVLFHSAREGGEKDAATEAAKGFLATVETHLASLKSRNSWLHSKAGLLSAEAKHQPVQGYREYYGNDDGEGELVFAKTSFTFVPGLVLLGNMADIDVVKF